MKRFIEKFLLFRNSCSSGAILMVLIAFAVLTGANFTVSALEQKEKKPRFQLTAISLRDGKSRLEWFVQQDGTPLSLSWYKTMEYVAGLNKERYGGFRDWRIPTREELFSLVEYAKSAGFDGSAGKEISLGLQKIGLAQVQNEHLWSSTDDMYNDRLAWAVDMTTGLPERIEKHLYENVIAVRSIR